MLGLLGHRVNLPYPLIMVEVYRCESAWEKTGLSGFS